MDKRDKFTIANSYLRSKDVANKILKNIESMVNKPTFATEACLHNYSKLGVFAVSDDQEFYQDNNSSKTPVYIGNDNHVYISAYCTGIAREFKFGSSPFINANGFGQGWAKEIFSIKLTDCLELLAKGTLEKSIILLINNYFKSSKEK